MHQLRKQKGKSMLKNEKPDEKKNTSKTIPKPNGRSQKVSQTRLQMDRFQTELYNNDKILSSVSTRVSGTMKFIGGGIRSNEAFGGPQAQMAWPPLTATPAVVAVWWVLSWYPKVSRVLY